MARAYLLIITECGAFLAMVLFAREPGDRAAIAAQPSKTAGAKPVDKPADPLAGVTTFEA